ncbi:MAG: hypothetical protein QM767_05195 [Anaeromyxobacter sp.]
MPPAPARPAGEPSPAPPGSRLGILLEPDAGAWEGAVAEYLRAFRPEDPVALVVALDPQNPWAPSEEQAGERLVALIGRLGLASFPELRVARAGELRAELAEFGQLRWAPPPDGQAGNRFARWAPAWSLAGGGATMPAATAGAAPAMGRPAGEEAG